MKAIAVRDGNYEGQRIRKGQPFDFDETKYRTKSKNPWYVPADRAKVIKPSKQGPMTLKEAGSRGNGKGFVETMKSLAGADSGSVRVEVAPDDLAK